ncbi:MAG: tRNA uridine 5-carboxymethylaminomethyl modification enzyme MnmG [Saprospiraceae bacterium]|nr:tRNA uridine 5-carboxymethylaminomethyl modification enzyme MnmG [Saprospiraceae bacterium]
MFSDYDVIVVGAGHAGCEAALAAANRSCRVMLVTMNMQTIAQMSCNPAMGGVAKGQIVREIDALGGASGIVTDETRVQFRMLNRSKGPAMWSPRAQSDRNLFARRWRTLLEAHPGIDFWQDTVRELIVEGGAARGVITTMGHRITGRAVILTNGTFLNGVIHIGEKQYGGGRAGERAVTGLTEQLQSLGFESGRMKTGTPPRLDGRSIDYSRLEIQPGDQNPSRFSFLPTRVPEKQLCCHIAYTRPGVHEVLRTGFARSPMFSGRITGVGPRYCPSIEDKIDRFADRDRHQLFVEPEGWDTCEVYLNGFSSSLPEEVQFSALRRIEGFENVRMFRPGYAIEYDYFPPTQLMLSLETRLVANLFFAGQINGTTGYEEAACQGLVAGINAALKLRDEQPFVLSRSEAYIGVLIDDLVNKGTEEPYRMFTSRAEFRIMLRQDNADLRLTPRAAATSMQSLGPRLERVQQKLEAHQTVLRVLQSSSVTPDQINPYLSSIGSAPLESRTRLLHILTRPNVQLSALRLVVPEIDASLAPIDPEFAESAEIQIKYEGYARKEQEMAEKLLRLEHIKLHPDFDYHALNALSMEARTKLSRVKPASIGQASRISGVSPSDISILLVFLGR